jgi:hypothetical protein
MSNIENPEIAPKVTHILTGKGKCPEINAGNYQRSARETVFQSENFSIMARNP